MDPNEGGLSSYFHPHQQNPPPLSAVPPVSGGGGGINASPNNGGVVSNINTPHGGGSSHPNPTAALASATSSSPMAYSNTVPSPVSTGGLDGMKKRRGRPRKYATPEEAAAAKRQSSASNSASAQPKKKQHVLAGGSSAKLDAQVTAGDKVTPHLIIVQAGEDVYDKITSFVQQLKGEMCILSASGQVSHASLNHSAASGGSVTYEGIYTISSLNGSFVRTEQGRRSGGLSISLADEGNFCIGGGVGGPLIAFSPVQVILGTFVVDRKKDKTVAEAGKSPSPVGGGTSMSGLSFRSPNESYQNYTGGSHQYMNMNMNMQ